MLEVNLSVATDLPVHSQTGWKKVPEIDGFCFGNSHDCFPIHLIAKRIEEDNSTAFPPISFRTKSLYLSVCVATYNGNSLNQIGVGLVELGEAFHLPG